MRGSKDIGREIAEKSCSTRLWEGKEKEEKELFEKLDKQYVKKEEVKLWIALSNLPKNSLPSSQKSL